MNDRVEDDHPNFDLEKWMIDEMFEFVALIVVVGEVTVLALFHLLGNNCNQKSLPLLQIDSQVTFAEDSLPAASEHFRRKVVTT